MSGTMIVTSKSFYGFDDSHSSIEDDSLYNAQSVEYTTRCIPSIAEHCKSRDEIRSLQFSKRSARDLADKLSAAILERCGNVWESVDPDVMVWCPSGEDEPSTVMRDPRGVLPFHIAACIDMNECEL